MLLATVLICGFGLVYGAWFAGNAWTFLIAGMVVIGLTYGPCGTILAELFPTRVRYTGASLAFNLAGIIGASMTPYVAKKLGDAHGLPYVGYYLTAAGVLTLLALLLMPRKAATSDVAR